MGIFEMAMLYLYTKLWCAVLHDHLKNTHASPLAFQVDAHASWGQQAIVVMFYQR